MKKLVVAMLVVLSALSSCKTSRQGKADPSLFRNSFTGYDFEGGAKVCYSEDITKCQAPSDVERKFAELCEDEGHEAFRCDCNFHLCSYNVAEGKEGAALRQMGVPGYDSKGIKKSCRPVSESVFCSQVETAQDKFAKDCVRLGYRAIKCGCHDYLCSKRIGS